MIYLISLAVIVAFAGYLPSRYELQYNNYKKYIWICGVLIALIAALRTPYTGTGDNVWYTARYLSLQNYSSFRDYYNLYLSGNRFLFSEAGFYYFMWLFGRVFQDGQMAIAISSLWVTFATCRFIYRNSKDVPLSLTIYVCLGLFTFNMNAMRQAIAMSICLFAYEFCQKRKLMPFLLTVMTAMLFHKTALCFLPMYFLPMLKNNTRSWLLYISGLVLCLVFVDKIVAGYYQIGGKDYDGGTAADGGGLFVVLMYLGAIVLTLYNPRIMQKQPARTAMLATLAGFTAYIARYIGIGILERVSYYYFYFPMMLIPELFQELDDEEYKVIKLIFILGSIVLFAYRIWKGTFSNFTFFFL